MEEIRLQKFLANSGICSRRKAEEYIVQGKVELNNKVVKELGTKVNPNNDIIKFNGEVVAVCVEHRYILLNKPIGYVTTVKEQFGRPAVVDLIKEENLKLLPVGRLDMYTSGALMLTNDGDFIYKVTHPKSEVEKTYNATVNGIVDSQDIEKLKNGVKIDNYISGKAKVKVLNIDKEKGISKIEIVIHEGKNREVRKMCDAIGKGVIALHRSKIGEISVKNLKIGEYRNLTQEEIKKVLSN